MVESDIYFMNCSPNGFVSVNKNDSNKNVTKVNKIGKVYVIQRASSSGIFLGVFVRSFSIVDRYANNLDAANAVKKAVKKPRSEK